jgi:hypothetical protein
MHATAILLTATLLATAGCLGGPAGEATTPSTAPPTPTGALAAKPAPSPAPVRTVANWTGFMTVGAADEAPSHVDETNGATGAVWSPSFHYDVQQAPQDLEVRLDWTATAGQLEFMVILPGNGTMGETMVETGFADQGPLCAKLPAGHLAPGSYSIMAHSRYAIDAHLHFTITMLGGQGHLTDTPHTAPAAGLAAYAASLAGGGDGGSLTPEPCTAG